MFKNALPVYPENYLNERNIQVYFPVDFPKLDNPELLITGENEFQVFLNGKLIGYGPARAAHHFHRVDRYALSDLKDQNRLLIVLCGYNVNSFDRINEAPFVRFELLSNGNVVEASNLDTPCYLNPSHIQKVTRFSYQRNFSESYRNSYTDDWKKPYFYQGERLRLKQVSYGELLDRNVSYPRFGEEEFTLREKNAFCIDETKKAYENRYMRNDAIITYKKHEWEVDPNEYVSKMVFGKSIRPLSCTAQDEESLAYDLPVSLTGFFHLRLTVIKEAVVYLHFEEYNLSEDPAHIEFNFYRNTTHNIVSYHLMPGEYDLVTFLPYTSKYARLSVEKGSVKAVSLFLIRLENPDVRLGFSFADDRLNEIFKAAANTYRVNAVDILTDCPSRERAGWLFDSYFSGRAEPLFTGKSLVEHNFLENYAMYRPHGDVETDMVPMCYPADFPEGAYIPNWAMWYVIELCSFMERYHDDSLLKLSKNNIEGLLRYFASLENEDGMLENLRNWVFVEWSPANDKESICGVNMPSNMLYAAFLDAVAFLLHDDSYKTKADKLRVKIRELGYRDGFFIDNLIRDEEGKLISSGRVGETTQYYAFYFGTADKETYPELWDNLLHKFGPNRDVKTVYSSIYKSNVLPGDFLRLELLNRESLCDEVLNETVDYFYKMAVITGTLWEHDSVFASLNHGFTSYVANVIVTAVSGLENIDYANKTVSFKPTSYKKDYKLEIPLGDEMMIVKQKDGIRIIDCPADFEIK